MPPQHPIMLVTVGHPKNAAAMARQMIQAPITSRLSMANAAGWYHIVDLPVEGRLERVTAADSKPNTHPCRMY
jgi:hypothetical protein